MDPAIYGIEPSDVGVEGHEERHQRDLPLQVGSADNAIAAMLATPGPRVPHAIPHEPRERTIVDDVVADTRNRYPVADNLDAHIGMSGAASAQSAPLSRADHMNAAEGYRGGAMGAQIMLAAKNIEAAVAEIRVTLNSPLGNRSPDAKMARLEQLVASAVAQRTRTVMVAEEQQRLPIKVPPDKEALAHLDHASHELDDVVMRVQRFASQHQLPLDKKVTSRAVSDDVDRLEKAFQTEVDGSKTGDVKEKEAALELESLAKSLDALDSYTQALVLAVNEPSPDQKIKEVLPRLHSNLRFFEASLVPGVRPTPQMRKLGTRIKFAIEKAWTDAGPHGLQKSLEPTRTSLVNLPDRLAKAK